MPNRDVIFAARGTLSASHPGVCDDGNFAVEITMAYRAAAIIDPVPIPGAVWLSGSAIVGLVGLRHRAA